MNNTFKPMVENLSQEQRAVMESKNLQELRESYFNYKNSLNEIHDWIINTTDEKEKEEYLNMIRPFEFRDNKSIPVFDKFFDPNESYDEYEGYYQRYGCTSADSIVSYDTDNFLFDDGGFNFDIAIRPDVLMNLSA